MLEFRYNFIDGACVEYNCPHNYGPIVTVDFIDFDTKDILYRTDLTPNTWARTSIKKFINWGLVGSVDGKVVFNHIFSLSGKRVIMVFPHNTLKEFLFWLPAVEKFRRIKKCNMIVSCSQASFINVVNKSYPDIWFTTDYNSVMNECVYALYRPYLDDIENFLNIENTLPLVVDSDLIHSPIDVDYVCIAEHGNGFPWKSWCNPDGYPTVAKFLNDKGYRVVPVSLEPTNLNGIEGVIDMTGKNLRESIRIIKHSKLFIGGDSALTWIANILNIPTIMICTCGLPGKDKNIHYVYNHKDGSCYGCLSQSLMDKCDKPLNPMPECVMNITPEMVIDKIKHVLTV